MSVKTSLSLPLAVLFDAYNWVKMLFFAGELLENRAISAKVNNQEIKFILCLLSVIFS